MIYIRIVVESLVGSTLFAIFMLGCYVIVCTALDLLEFRRRRARERAVQAAIENNKARAARIGAQHENPRHPRDQRHG